MKEIRLRKMKGGNVIMKKISLLVLAMLLVGTIATPFVLGLSFYPENRNNNIPEDLNHDGFVDRQDLRIVLANWGSCSRDFPRAVAEIDSNGADTAIREPYFRCLGDVNLDEKVDMADILRILEAWNPKPSSDLNGDGKIDQEDLQIVLNEWGQEDSKADLNRDGTVDMEDVNILLRDWRDQEGRDNPRPLTANGRRIGAEPVNGDDGFVGTCGNSNSACAVVANSQTGNGLAE